MEEDKYSKDNIIKMFLSGEKENIIKEKNEIIKFLLERNSNLDKKNRDLLHLLNERENKLKELTSIIQAPFYNNRT